MQQQDYKQDVLNTRVGCLGASDAKLLAQVANGGGVIPKSALKRLAVVKGLIPNVDTPSNTAMRYGDAMEMAIYNHLAENNDEYQSNPLWVSRTYSRKNVKLIAHPDIVKYDYDTKTILVYEVKTTKDNIESTKANYRMQIYIQWLLAKEIANTLGKEWKVRNYLVHYSTQGIDIENDWEFRPENVTISECRVPRDLIDVPYAMDAINEFLDTFDNYYTEDEIDADMLPVAIKQEFDLVANTLKEIKEREATVEEFKKRVYEFLCDKGIKSIKNDVFSIIRIDPSTASSFDYKRYLADMAAEHPRKAKKLQQQYSKQTNRKGYAKITIH